MNKVKRAFFMILLSSVFVCAEEDYDKAVSSFNNYPSKITEEVQWNAPYDETYLPYDVCRNVENFEVKSVEEKVKSYFDHKDGLLDINHYHALVSIVRITYEVTCMNKLKYTGTYYLFSNPHKLNENYSSDDEEEEFYSHAFDWKLVPVSNLQADGNYVNPETGFSGYGKNKTPLFSIATLKEYWKKQKVGYPEWVYMGEPGKKMPRPVMFIHGLQSSFEVWGVEALSKDKSSGEYKNGLVKKYDRGSAPDVLCRYLNIDNTEKSINHNGIYFFQSPNYKFGNEYVNVYPQWNVNDQSTSQSRKLYDDLVNAMDDFYNDLGVNWRENDNTTIDLVTHSQGGLVVREMLRGLRENSGAFPIGTANVANHIGRIVTVNTPHSGSLLAVQDPEKIEDGYLGLKYILEDLNAAQSGNPVEHTLISADIEPNVFMKMAVIGYMKACDVSDALGWDDWYSIFQPVGALLGFVGGAIMGLATDISVTVKGPYIGTYQAEVFVDLPGPWNRSITMKIDKLEKVYDKISFLRAHSGHLDKNGAFMTTLNRFDNGYPQKPNGSPVSMQPLYSENTDLFFKDLMGSLGKEADRLCKEQDEDDEEGYCYTLPTLFDALATTLTSYGDYVDYVKDLEIEEDFWNALVNIQNNWFGKGDAVVEKESQVFQNARISGADYESYFETEKNYIIHDKIHPWESVAHIGFEVSDITAADAPTQGFDIACALEDYCNKILVAKDNVYNSENNSIDFAGDFDLAPMFLSSGTQGIMVSDGQNYVKAYYNQSEGSVVEWTDENGTPKKDIVKSAQIATEPALVRKGENITAVFRNYSGRIFEKKIAMAKMSPLSTVSVISDYTDNASVLIVGNGKATNISEPTLPTDKKKHSWNNIFVLHRESGQTEKNTARPRMLIANMSDKPINGFKVAYFFTADKMRLPNVVVDDPAIPVELDYLGDDKWRFVLDGSDFVVPAKSFFPDNNQNGWQIRMHYWDWTDFDIKDDWSWNHNTGIPSVNPRIVVYDMAGNILWGEEPEFESNDAVEMNPVVDVSWYDSAPYDMSMFKPAVKVTNVGNVPLKDYTVKLWFRVPDGKQLSEPTYDWYTPEAYFEVDHVGQNVWEMSFVFDKYILYENQSVDESNVGLNLVDWSPFDKTICGIAVYSEGKIIYGKKPTVEECAIFESEENLIQEYVLNKGVFHNYALNVGL